jgi:hypothetical protein
LSEILHRWEKEKEKKHWNICILVQYFDCEDLMSIAKMKISSGYGSEENYSLERVKNIHLLKMTKIQNLINH